MKHVSTTHVVVFDNMLTHNKWSLSYSWLHCNCLLRQLLQIRFLLMKNVCNVIIQMFLWHLLLVTHAEFSISCDFNLNIKIVYHGRSIRSSFMLVMWNIVPNKKITLHQIFGYVLTDIYALYTPVFKQLIL